jgi:biotin-(acetyl-CoA carboxylase) ligase
MTGENTIIGKAIKIDNDGALIISKGKKTIRLLVGDIIHD